MRVRCETLKSCVGPQICPSVPPKRPPEPSGAIPSEPFLQSHSFLAVLMLPGCWVGVTPAMYMLLIQRVSKMEHHLSCSLTKRSGVGAVLQVEVFEVKD